MALSLSDADIHYHLSLRKKSVFLIHILLFSLQNPRAHFLLKAGLKVQTVITSLYLYPREGFKGRKLNPAVTQPHLRKLQTEWERFHSWVTEHHVTCEITVF